MPNRLCKAAMTEGLADPWGRATDRHVTLYRRWAESGAGLLLSGNIQIDRRITSVKVVEILGGHVVSGLGRDFGEGGGLVVAEAIHCLLRHVAML